MTMPGFLLTEKGFRNSILRLRSIPGGGGTAYVLVFNDLYLGDEDVINEIILSAIFLKNIGDGGKGTNGNTWDAEKRFPKIGSILLVVLFVVVMPVFLTAIFFLVKRGLSKNKKTGKGISYTEKASSDPYTAGNAQDIGMRDEQQDIPLQGWQDDTADKGP